MKRSMFRLLTVLLLSIWAGMHCTDLPAQGNGGGHTFPPSPFAYSLHTVFGPQGTEDIVVRDFKVIDNCIVAVGDYVPPGEHRRGFIYVYDLTDNVPPNFIDAIDQYGLVNNQYAHSFRGISLDGMIVGASRDDDTRDSSSNHAIWCQVNETTLNILEVQFSELAGVGGHFAQDVNNFGDILVRLHGSAQTESPLCFVVNPILNELIRVVTGQPGQGDIPQAINDSRLIVGEIDSTIYRHNANSNATQTFPDLTSTSVRDINNNGEFCGGYRHYYRSNRYTNFAYRFGSQMDWSSDPIESTSAGAYSLNDARDTAYTIWESRNGLGDVPDVGVFYHAGVDQSFLIRDMVDDPLFSASDTRTWYFTLSNTGPNPIISGVVQYDWDTLRRDGLKASFFLIPDVPGPGVTVTPTTGLTTTEGGGTDSFDVFLDSEPSADVTIGISSSNSNEGAVDQVSLTFTPANWDTPQTVTITGVDDAIEDGDVAYTIVTAAATSADPDYDGLDADDVSVVNEDDELPPGGGSATYDSADTPTDIPDQGTIFSVIDIPDDFGIVGMTVNLNITHQRTSDLQVTLIGPAPEFLEVPLSNFNGENVVTAFNDSSSLGEWTLEVRDTRKKRTGTLNGWSITVEY